VAVTPNSDYAYVVNYAGDSVSQINTQTNVVVNTIGVGTHPAGISITANGSSVYVTNTGGNSVSVINTTLSYVTTTIAVKSQPFGVAMTQKLPMPTPYPYHVLPVAGYLATKPYGNVTVQFDNVTVDVQFLHAFAITFNAVGRTNSAPWSVTLNGTRQSSSSNAIIFEELNGTYLWNVTLINYYEINPTSGIANVTGGALNITIYFTHIWLIDIVEQGLPSGTVWSVTFNGQIYSTNTNTITLRVTNGSVYWYINGISGYLSNPASWENYVSQNYTINVTFSPQPPNPYNLFMQWDFYILLVIVVMPVALYFIFRRRRK
jgi:YVTN family beta-propeller protein